MDRRGFSLLQVMLILAALSILAAQIISPVTVETVDTDLAAKTVADMKLISNAAQLYFQSGVNVRNQNAWPERFEDLSILLPENFSDRNPFSSSSIDGRYRIENYIRDANGDVVGIDLVTEMPTKQARRIEFALEQIELETPQEDVTKVHYYIMMPSLERSHDFLVHRQGDSIYGALKLSPAREGYYVHNGENATLAYEKGEALSLDWGESIKATTGEIESQPRSLSNLENSSLHISFKQKNSNYGSRSGDFRRDAFKIGFISPTISGINGSKSSLGTSNEASESVFTFMNSMIGYFDGSSIEDSYLNSAYNTIDEYSSAGLGIKLNFIPFSSDLADTQSLISTLAASSYLGAVSISPSALVLDSDTDVSEAKVRDLTDWNFQESLAATGSALIFYQNPRENEDRASYENAPMLSSLTAKNFEGKLVRLLSLTGVSGVHFQVKDASSLIAVRTSDNEDITEATVDFFLGTDPSNSISTNGYIVKALVDTFASTDPATNLNGESYNMQDSSSQAFSSAKFRMDTEKAFSFNLWASSLSSKSVFEKPIATEGTQDLHSGMSLDAFNLGERFDKSAGLQETYRLNYNQVYNVIIHQYDRVKFMTHLDIGDYDVDNPSNSRPPEPDTESYSSLWRNIFKDGPEPSSSSVSGLKVDSKLRFIDVQARRFLNENQEDLSAGFTKVYKDFLGCLEGETINAQNSSCAIQLPACKVGQEAKAYIGFSGVFLPEEMNPFNPLKSDNWAFEAYKEIDPNNSSQWIIYCEAVRDAAACNTAAGCVRVPCFVNVAVGCFDI